MWLLSALGGSSAAGAAGAAGGAAGAAGLGATAASSAIPAFGAMGTAAAPAAALGTTTFSALPAGTLGAATASGIPSALGGGAALSAPTLAASSGGGVLSALQTLNDYMQLMSGQGGGGGKTLPNAGAAQPGNTDPIKGALGNIGGILKSADSMHLLTKKDPIAAPSPGLMRAPAAGPSFSEMQFPSRPPVRVGSPTGTGSGGQMSREELLKLLAMLQAGGGGS